MRTLESVWNSTVWVFGWALAFAAMAGLRTSVKKRST
jgi:hypothetical protein